MGISTQDGGSDQYLTFRLGDEQYAFKVDSVREVIEYTKVTKIPRAARSMRGVINIRGSMIPVFDLKLLFDMGTTEKTADTSIIVLELEETIGLVAMGALADSVQEVIRLDPTSIERPPALGTASIRHAVRGIGKLGDRFVTILDIHQIFGESGEEMPIAEAVLAENA